MSNDTRALLRLSFPIAGQTGRGDGARRAQDASLRFLLERAEDALQGHATLIEASRRMRRTILAADAR